ncbi:PocR ligand-binding domain-containing protein [Anaerovorax odorimutans]|uniref:PocR ligand-binding domain-containing protein n=1 Tax=Anaerovorax odorimutans TaxID=109327 RepID=UPI00040764CF|nr:PocR ligand-binding domain-containing protein [Anaerovorax odorimutans]
MEYELNDLVEISQLQKLLDDFYVATGVGSGIIARDGTILTSTKWSNICTKFHRVNKESRLSCIESDRHLLEQFENKCDMIDYKCKNGLIDVGTPIVVEGKFLATLYIGQILFEEPDTNYFKKQAKYFGFDEEEYLKALKEVPIVDKEHYTKVLQFLKSLAQIISEIGLRELKLIEAKKELEISNNRYEIALHGSNDALWDYDLINNEFYASNRFIEMLGYNLEEINDIVLNNSIKLNSLIHPKDKNNFLKKYFNHINKKTEHFASEVRIKTKSENYKWILIRGSSIWNKDRKNIRMAGSVTDLSNKKELEVLLEDEKYFSKILMDYSNMFVCMWNPDGKLLYVNEYAQSILGYDEEELLDFNWMNITTKEIVNLLLKCLDANFTNNNIPQREIDIKCKDGKTVTILWNIQIIRNEEDIARNIVGIGVDITYKADAEKELMEFFGNISHELRTPLNIIFSSLQLMEFYFSNKNVLENVNKLKGFEKSMKQNCYRLLRLVNNIIAVTKINSGYLMLDLQKVDIVLLVNEIVESITEYIHRKNLDIKLNIDIKEKIIYCDPDKIERIILNLISNSIKFTKPGGTIFVNLKDNTEHIIISIKDTGIGIEKDKQDIIFKRFTQVNKSFVREQEGSGIGLSLVKSLVEMHNGSIKLKSDYGEGSEFIIKLPINNMSCCQCDKNDDELLNSKFSNKIEKINIELSDIY